MPKILIVEDEPDMARMEEMILRSAGYETESARSLSEAKASLLKGRPDLILLDIILPGDHGDELLKHMAKDPKLKNIPVVVVTVIDAVTGIQDDLKQIKPGVEFLSKPFKKDDLLAKAKAML